MDSGDLSCDHGVHIEIFCTQCCREQEEQERRRQHEKETRAAEHSEKDP